MQMHMSFQVSTARAFGYVFRVLTQYRVHTGMTWFAG
jgi:hypothetical protein